MCFRSRVIPQYAFDTDPSGPRSDRPGPHTAAKVEFMMQCMAQARARALDAQNACRTPSTALAPATSTAVSCRCGETRGVAGGHTGGGATRVSVTDEAFRAGRWSMDMQYPYRGDDESGEEGGLRAEGVEAVHHMVNL